MRITILLGAISEIVYLSLYLLPEAAEWRYPGYIAAALVNFFIYFIAVAQARGARDDNNRALITIFLFAILFRLSLLALPPFTSDDIYRYVWDGRVQAAGVNPYLYAPSSARLARLRDEEIYPYINHPHLPTVYPPLAQAGFVCAYLMSGGSLLGFKLLSLVAEIVTGWLLMRLLVRMARPRGAIIIYCWCPLPILEFFISGHVDALAIPFLLLFLNLMLSARVSGAGVALAGAVLVKVVPLVLLPAIICRLGLKKALLFCLAFALAIGVVYSPYSSAGREVFGSLGNYVRDWSFNGPIFPVFAGLTGSYGAARIICYSLIVIWTAIVALRERDLIRASFGTLAGSLLLAPTLYPWYLTWLVPLLVFVPARAFLLLLALTQLSYLVLVDYRQAGLWQESALARVVEYLPFFLLLIWDNSSHNFKSRSDYDDRRQAGKRAQTTL